MPVVYIKDKDLEINFPDSMSPEAIQAVLKKKYPPKPQAPLAPERGAPPTLSPASPEASKLLRESEVPKTVTTGQALEEFGEQKPSLLGAVAPPIEGARNLFRLAEAGIIGVGDLAKSVRGQSRLKANEEGEVASTLPRMIRALSGKGEMSEPELTKALTGIDIPEDRQIPLFKSIVDPLNLAFPGAKGAKFLQKAKGLKKAEKLAKAKPPLGILKPEVKAVETELIKESATDIDPILKYVDEDLGLGHIKLEKNFELKDLPDVPTTKIAKASPNKILESNNDKQSLDDLESMLDDFAFGKDPTRLEELNTRAPNKFAQMTDGISQWVNRKLSESKSRGGLARHMDFFTQRGGRTREQLTKGDQFFGGREMAKDQSGGVYTNMNEGLSVVDQKNISQALRGKVDKNQLQGLARERYDIARKTNDYIHELNYGATGMRNQVLRKRLDIGDINMSQYKRELLNNKKIYDKNKGKYVADLYDIHEFPDELNKSIAGKAKFDTGMYKQKKASVPDEWKDQHLINDPGYLTSKRLLQTHLNREYMNFSNWIVDNRELWNNIPKKGFMQMPDTASYGILSGKYVRSDIARDIMGFTTEINSLDTLYRGLKVIDVLRRPIKAGKTILNPGVRVGNRMGNKVFSYLNGMPELSMPMNKYAKFGKNQIKIKGNAYRELKREGLLGRDFSKTELEQSLKTGLPSGKEEAAELVMKATPKKGLKKLAGKAEEVYNKIARSYGEVDDSYKVGAYKLLLERGMSKVDAIKKIKQSFQDYQRVGWAWDVLAKTPIVGKPFVKFTPELTRILYNGMKSNPMWTISMLGGMGLLSDAGSYLSGETTEERKLRESDPSSPKMFGKIATQVLTPWGEVDMRRWLALNQLTQISEFKRSGNPLAEMGVPDTLNIMDTSGDVLFSPLLAQAQNKDVFGRPIASSSYERGVDAVKPRARHLADAYLPVPVSPSNISKVSSAFTKEEGGLNLQPFEAGKPDIRGKRRTPAQTVAETGFGFRFRQYGPKEKKEIEEKIKIIASVDISKRDAELRRLPYRHDYTDEQKIAALERAPGIVKEDMQRQFDKYPEIGRVVAARVQKIANDIKLKMTELKIIPTGTEFMKEGEVDRKTITETVLRLRTEIMKKPMTGERLTERTMKEIEGQTKQLKFFEKVFDTVLKDSESKAIYLLDEMKLVETEEEKRGILKRFMKRGLVNNDVLRHIVIIDPQFMQNENNPTL